METSACCCVFTRRNVASGAIKGGPIGMKDLARRGILGLSIAVAGVFAAAAQTPPKRPFDAASGILVSCVPAPGYDWTGSACQRLIADVQQRATGSKVPAAPIEFSPDLMRKQLGQIG